MPILSVKYVEEAQPLPTVVALKNESVVLAPQNIHRTNISQSDEQGAVNPDRRIHQIEADGHNRLDETSKKPLSDPWHHLFGFFYQVYKQPKATLELVRSVNKHMPHAPIYMISSGGYHYDPLAARFPQIGYQYDDNNVNLPGGGNLSLWFDRVYAAATWCNCTFLVLLEDDVQLRKPLQKPPQHDAGGVEAHLWAGRWTKDLKDRFAGKWSYESSGMCGGSYVRTEAFIEAYSRIDWNRIQEMGKLFPAIGRFNDVTLAVIMMDTGHILKPWNDLTEVGNRFHRDSASIAHQYKRYYNQPLAKDDGSITIEANLSHTDRRPQATKWKNYQGNRK